MIRSFRRYHSGGRFFVLLVDAQNEHNDLSDEPFEILQVEELNIVGIEAMRMRYDIANFCAAVRPPLLRHLIDRGSKKIVYLDPDLFFLGPMRALSTLLHAHQVILTPQVTAPFPADQVYPEECFTLGAGVFNSGFVALSRGTSTDAFLQWWGKRLRHFCFRRPDEYMFGDQKWLDFVPFFFQGTHVITDPSYNVAFWNFHERPLAYQAGMFTARGVPVTFFHMSEFKPGSPPIFTWYQPTYGVESAVGKLAALYQQELFDAGYERQHRVPYAFDCFENGVNISPIIRKIFDEIDGEKLFPHPFSANEHSYLHWLLEPVTTWKKHGYLMRLHLEIHRLSMEASLKFPSPDGADRERFARWLLLHPQRIMYMLDRVFLLSLRPLAKRVAVISMQEYIRPILNRRHTFLPYQLLCQAVRTVLGNRRFEQLKPRKSVYDRSDPYLTQRLITWHSRMAQGNTTDSLPHP